MKKESPDHLEQLREIFEIVADLPEIERARKLDELCVGNSGLRRGILIGS